MVGLGVRVRGTTINTSTSSIIDNHINNQNQTDNNQNRQGKSNIKSPITKAGETNLPQLEIGADVSAKYRGAWCEGKVIKRQDITNCKVVFDNGIGHATIKDVDITGTIAPNESVVALEPHSGKELRGTIQHIKNGSLYTVRFADGDERTVSRNKVTLKGPGHYNDGLSSMGTFPISDPDNFGSASGTQTSTTDDASSRKRRRTSDVGVVASEQEEITQPPIRPSVDVPADVGDAIVPDGLSHQAVLVNPCRDGTGDGRFWWPALIVPAAEVMRDMIGAEDVDPKVCFVVRFFEDNLYAIIEHKYVKHMQRYTNPFERFCKMNTGRFLKMPAVQRALQYLDHGKLKENFKWKTFSSKCDKEAAAAAAWEKQHNVGGTQAGSRWNPNPIVERNFLSSLTEYMARKGTPIKRTPSVGFKDLDLFKLYTLVQKQGGYEKANDNDNWREIYGKLLNLDDQVVPATGDQKMHNAYEKYLKGYEKYMNPSKISPVDERQFDEKRLDEGDTARESAPCSLQTSPIKFMSNQRDGGADSDETDEGPFLHKIGKLARCTYKDGKRYMVLVEARRLVNVDGSTTAKDSAATKAQYKVHYQNWARKYDQWVDTDKIADITEGSSAKKRRRDQPSEQSVDSSRRKIKKKGGPGSNKMTDEELARTLQIAEATGANRRRETRRSWSASMAGLKHTDNDDDDDDATQLLSPGSNSLKNEDFTEEDDDMETASDLSGLASMTRACYAPSCNLSVVTGGMVCYSPLCTPLPPLHHNRSRHYFNGITSPTSTDITLISDGLVENSKSPKSLGETKSPLTSQKKLKTTPQSNPISSTAITRLGAAASTTTSMDQTVGRNDGMSPEYTPKFVPKLDAMADKPITTQLEYLRGEFSKHSFLAKNYNAMHKVNSNPSSRNSNPTRKR